MARTVNEQHRRQRRDAICAAAEKRFAANGFASTTISSIAKEANISHASVFNYFKSKDELIEAVVLEPLQESLTNIHSVLTQDKPPVETLRDLTEMQLRNGEQRRTYLRVVQQVLGQPEQYPQLSQAVSEYAEKFVDDVRSLIEKGQRDGVLESGNPYEIAWTYFAFINGAGLIFLGPYDGFIKQTVEYAMRIFGVRKRREPS